MAYHCGPCDRTFKDQAGLNQHLRTSTAHRRPSYPIHGPPESRNAPSSKRQQTGSSQLQNSAPNIRPAQAPYGGTVPAPQSGPSVVRPSGTSQRSNHHFSAPQQPPKQLSNGNLFYPPPPQVTPATLRQEIPHWASQVPESEHLAVLDALIAECHSLEDLKENGYILEPYKTEDYENKRKCFRCHSREDRVKDHPCVFHSFKRNKYNLNKPYRCCDTIDGKGCQTSPNHDFRLSIRAETHKDFLPTPAASPERQKLRAVVFDCEMAGISGGGGETILLCASDYLTGEVLIHRFVNPSERITQMRSEIHGISMQTLNHASSQRQALSGWVGARAELWKHIDADTILIGHALHHDLDSLRMIHHRVVDSGILARNAIGFGRVQRGLSALCEELMQLEIRKSEKGIHECLEDVLATREVVLFCTLQREKFLTWAAETKVKEQALEAEREKVREEKKNADWARKEREAKEAEAAKNGDGR